MAFFPFMTEIEGKNILIVGGGKSAFHKVRSFLLFGGTITVIAKKVSPDITRLSGDIKVFERPFTEADLEGKSIVIAATDDKQLNRAMAEKARSAGIPAHLRQSSQKGSAIMRELSGAQSLILQRSRKVKGSLRRR